MHVPMSPIALERAKEIATEKNLKPGKVRGTMEIEFTRGTSPRVDVIDWPDLIVNSSDSSNVGVTTSPNPNR